MLHLNTFMNKLALSVLPVVRVTPSASPVASESMLSAMFGSLPAAAWVVDLSGRYCHVTDAFATLVNRTVDECLGRTVEEVMPFSLARVYALRHRQIQETQGRKRFEQVWPIRGEPSWFEIHMSCLRDAHGKPMGVAGYAQDVTQHMAQQEAARRIQASLEKRVTQRTLQLSIANQELEAFSYSVSHDLHAPLRAIQGFARLLDEHHADSLDEMGLDYLRHIVDSSTRMGELIADLLQLARVNQGGVHRTRIDISAMARELLGELSMQDPQRRVEQIVPPPIYVECDAGLTRVALANLLSNAWKFTARAENASIQFGHFQRGNCPVYFVRDNGAGFDMKYTRRMFGAFQRFHNEADFSGSGIGLATVKRVIGRHGGQVWAESSPDHGATFYFTLGSHD